MRSFAMIKPSKKLPNIQEFRGSFLFVCLCHLLVNRIKYRALSELRLFHTDGIILIELFENVILETTSADDKNAYLQRTKRVECACY